jgi:hypothetical protein
LPKEFKVISLRASAKSKIVKSLRQLFAEAKIVEFRGLNSKLSEMLVQFFYEFASENARNAVMELQE